MYNGFFQNHMDPTAMPWLAIMSPFGGLRIMTGSSQGLLRQSEKFNILLKKVLKEELQEGICCQIIDDVYVSCQTQEQTANNYIHILHTLALANL